MVMMRLVTICIVSVVFGVTDSTKLLDPVLGEEERARLRARARKHLQLDATPTAYDTVKDLLGSRYGRITNEKCKWILKQVAADRTIPKIFVDVGAHDGVGLSNTQQLEANGWHGTCVDPMPTNFMGRKCNLIKKAVAKEHIKNRSFSDCSGGNSGLTPRFQRGNSGLTLSGFKHLNKNVGLQCKLIHVDQITPAELLAEAGAPSVVGYISLDIEGDELEFVKAFPWNTTCARLWTIELYGEDASKEQILMDTLANHGCEKDTETPGMSGGENAWDVHVRCNCAP